MSGLIESAWDVHLHAGPDVVPRVQRADEVLRDAKEAGMAAIGLKDHCGSTAALAAVLQASDPDGPRVLGSITLNPPVGGLNPHAVEAALREGARTVWFPTYSTKRHLDVSGSGPFPMAGDEPGLTILDETGEIKPQVWAILELIAEHGAVLATGHLDPMESLVLFRVARERRIQRMVLTHATLDVTDMSPAMQKECVRMGAVIEHCMLAMTPGCFSCEPERMVAEIREVGAEHVILSSDLGQVANGPVVQGFRAGLSRLQKAGLTIAEIRQAVAVNPRNLFD
jgi:hypothetical protein